MTYEQWIERVDTIIWQRVGCSIHDLMDFLLRDWYEDGMKPQTAARKAIKENQE